MVSVICIATVHPSQIVFRLAEPKHARMARLRAFGASVAAAMPRSAGERLVRAEGLEPPRFSPQEPKSCASTSSATPLKGLALVRYPARRGKRRPYITAFPARARAEGEASSGSETLPWPSAELRKAHEDGWRPRL